MASRIKGITVEIGGDTTGNTNLIWLAISVLIRGSGLLIAKLYKH